MTRQNLINGACVVVAIVCAYPAATHNLRQYIEAGGEPFYYQSQFAPAVSAACGQGYQNVSHSRAPQLTAFLHDANGEVECSALSNTVRVPLSSFQGISRYLEMSVAVVWWLRGLSWDTLAPLFGILYAISAAAVYGLFRLGTRSSIALAATLFLVFSPLQLQYLPHLRDYAKAPFVLSLLLLTILILRPRQSERNTRLLCAAAGAVLGLGLGFRNDLLLFVPIVGAAILCAPQKSGRPLLTIAARLGVALVGFVPIAQPILSAYSGGSNTWHVILLGMTVPFDEALGIVRPVYDTGHLYNDHYLYVLVRSFAERLTSVTGPILIGSPEYDAMTFRYLMTSLREFPADFIVRSYAAGMGVLYVPLETDIADVSWVTGWLGHLVNIRTAVVPWLLWPAAVSVILAAASLVGLGSRQGLVAVATIAGLAASAALQYQYRHFFYLEFATWWGLAVIVDRGLTAAKMRAFETSWRDWQWTRVAIVCLLVPLMAASLLIAARSYQQSRVRAALSALGHVPADPVPVTRTMSAEGVLFGFPSLGSFPEGEKALEHPVATAYYAIDFGGSECTRLALTPIVRYKSTRPFEDFTHTIDVPLPLDGRAVTVYLPGYSMAVRTTQTRTGFQYDYSSLAGIELPSSDSGCVSAVRRLHNTTLPPILLTAVLSDGWERSPLYQRFRWEASDPPDERLLEVPGGAVTRQDAQAVRSGPYVPETPKLAAGVTRVGEELHFDGVTEGPFTYAVTSAPRQMSVGSIGGVRGVLESGGVTVGLLKDGAWAGSVNVVEPGPFTVVLRTPSDGVYEIVVAHCLQEGERENHFTLDRFGWVERP